MWICPVCKKQNQINLICVRCGFDESSNYERYCTLTSVDVQAVSSMYQRRKQYGWHDVYKRGLAYLEIGDYEYAERYMKLAAENGDIDAQFACGSFYYGGIKENHKEAVRWFRKAVAQGHALAQYYLGRCYFLGEGGLLDYAEGVKWLEESKQGGCSEAEQFLEKHVYSLEDSPGVGGMNVLGWYQMLAGRGNVEAQLYLGDYWGSLGERSNYVEAAKWYQKAADSGSPKGKWKIGACYYHGQGVKQDLEKAVVYYRMAAAEDDETAQALLGMCYEFGSGVERNLKTAVMWYLAAAAHGNKEAKKRADSLLR